jgi:hypothetical protein
MNAILAFIVPLVALYGLYRLAIRFNTYPGRNKR